MQLSLHSVILLSRGAHVPLLLLRDGRLDLKSTARALRGEGGISLGSLSIADRVVAGRSATSQPGWALRVINRLP